MRKALAVTLGILFLLALPADLRSLADGLRQGSWLAAGVSCKMLLNLVAVVGLWKDKTYGYAFLLGAALHGGMVSYYNIMAVPPDRWGEYGGQLVLPAFDLAVRIAALLFLAGRPGRLVGKEVER